MGKVAKVITWLVAASVIFSIGYYLRAYIPSHKDLPYSPYEAFDKQDMPDTINTLYYVVEGSRHTTTNFLAKITNPVFGNLYIIYIAGAMAIFFLGKEITNKNLGGFLAFSIYALSSENLLQYMRTIGGSGLCYTFIWLSLLFILRYLKKKNNIDLLFFVLFSFGALTSYHTGATALILIFFGLLISLMHSNKLDKKIFMAIFVLTAFHLIRIVAVDSQQLTIMKEAITESSPLKIFCTAIFIISFLTFPFVFKNKRALQSNKAYLIIMLVSFILVFFDSHFFKNLLFLGAKNYYSSPITLNNYIGQTLLTHFYLIPLTILLFKRNLKTEDAFLRGWLIGIALIAGGLSLKNFYSRVLDYSFPLAFIAFGVHWIKHLPNKKRLGMCVIPLTMFLLRMSQFRIYNDPFSMRRYYNQNEINSVKVILSSKLGWAGKKIATDFRTSALFSRYGKQDIKFGTSGSELHDALFYNYSDIANTDVDYVILSESMKVIVYAANFETTPANDRLFEYYENNFNKNL